MRPLELLLLAGIFAIAVLSITYFRRPWPPSLLRAVLVSGGVLVVVQILWEGWRWQMLPAYLAIIAVIFFSTARNPLSRGLSIANLIASIAVSAALGYLFPVFKL